MYDPRPTIVRRTNRLPCKSARQGKIRVARRASPGVQGAVEGDGASSPASQFLKTRITAPSPLPSGHTSQ